ncbi:MAG TPA: type II toxin-antitoxin system prevent-host-death family antitoxin [Gemmatimonadaceae bacterium]|nr:type II toxin-antitoxin system prevent-host-death family antitoxin [Gemmatimonadaceae bacterium]
MKSVKVSELKANLSRYLRMAAQGNRIVVTDRDEPIAQIVPPDADDIRWHERLARAGTLHLGSQQLRDLKFSSIRSRADIQESLRAIREDSA